MLKCRNIIIDTQFFLDKRLDFEHVELKALEGLVKQGLAKVYLTDITHREVIKKIDDEITSAFQKLSVTELRYLVNIPLYRRFKETYKKEGLIDFFETRFYKLIKKLKIEIITSSDVKMLPIFNDYCRSRPPFNNRKGKKAEFPDAISLAAIRAWAEKYNERAYLLSKDNDWVLFADNSYVFIGDERFFECISDLPKFTDLIFRTEDSLKDAFSFADSLLEKRSSDIISTVMKNMEDSGYEAYSSIFDVSIADVSILDVSIIFKQVLVCDRNSAVFSIEFACTGIFGYDVTDIEDAIGDSEDGIYRGKIDYFVSQKQTFPFTAELEINYKNGLESNFSIGLVDMDSNYDIDYDDAAAEIVTLEEWNKNIPIQICGVNDGKIMEDGSGFMMFENFGKAKEVFPSLDILKSSSEFTAAMGSQHFSKQLRFETWILSKLLSDQLSSRVPEEGIHRDEYNPLSRMFRRASGTKNNAGSVILSHGCPRLCWYEAQPGAAPTNKPHN